jgi:hypothetical protein
MWVADLIRDPSALTEYVVQFEETIPSNPIASISALHPNEMNRAAIKFQGRIHEPNGPN